MCTCAKAIKDLHHGDKGQDAGDGLDDAGVVGEEEGEMEAEGGKDCQVEKAEETGSDKGLH